MNRRLFLRSAAGLVLAAPFLGSRWQSSARAQAAATPRRSVIFHSPCGCLTNRWFPKVEHGKLDASALVGTTLQVLSPFVDKLLVPRGLRAVNAYGRPQFVDPHDQAMGSKLTCALIDNDPNRYASSHSLDHEIARQINPGHRDPLVLSVGPPSSNVKTILSYSGPSTPFPASVDPRAVYRGIAGILSDPRGELDHLRRRKRSVLDAVRDDLESYRRLEMSAADTRRVEAWLDLVRDTEQNLGSAACDTKQVGLDGEQIEAVGVDTDLASAFTTIADTMLRLIALALLCDSNRSFVLTFPGFVIFDWDGIHHTHDHDGLAHRTGSFAAGGPCVDGVIGMLAEIDAWYAAKFAKLVALLDSLPEGDSTLLDNTATVWLQEFSDGAAMNLNNMPIVIAGSAGGYFKQGVAVNVEGQEIGPGNSESTCNRPGDNLASVNTGSTGGNVPINKLYVTLLNALGCKAPDGGPVTRFGTLDSDVAEAGITNPGELSALRA